MANFTNKAYGPNSVGTFGNYVPRIFVDNDRNPTVNDWQNYALMDEWLNPLTDEWWKLVSLEGNSTSAGPQATWVKIPSGGTGYIGIIQTQDGNLVTPTNNIIQLSGGPNLTTTGTAGPNTATISLINGTDGQLLIGGGANPVWANLTSSGGTITITNTPNGINLEASGGGGAAVTLVGDTSFAVTLAGSVNVVGGTNINTVGNGAQTLTINATGMAGLTWTDVTNATQAMAVNSGYTANRASLITFTLPATAAFGSVFYVVGKGTGLWKIAQNGGQTIHFGAVNTTTGAGGYLQSTLQYDVIGLLCTVANTDFTVIQSIGDITYV